MPTPPYSPARVEIAIYSASSDGRYWGRYPNGDKPSGLAGVSAVATGATGNLNAQARFTGAASVGASASGILSGEASQSIIFQPAFGAQLGDPFGNSNAGNPTAILADFKTQALAMNAHNGTKTIKHVDWVFHWPTLEASQGVYTQGTNLLIQMFQFLATLSNGPYTLGFGVNVSGNGQTGSNSAPTGYCPADMIDNPTYGTVSGGNHGGCYYGAAGSGLGPIIRIWNANVMNRYRQMLAAIYAALEPLGFHVYRFDPFSAELSTGAQPYINAGYSDTAFIDVLGGTTGIPNGFAADVRTDAPNSILCIRPTFLRSGVTSYPSFFAAVFAHQWSSGNYDSTNESNPADAALLPGGTGNPKNNVTGDKQFCGQTVFNGPITSTDYRAQGQDFHCYTNTDEWGQRNTPDAAVPQATYGTGRVPDILSHTPYMQASHHYLRAQNFSGPNCNCMTGSNSGGPANYKYPASGAIVPYTNAIDYIAALGGAAAFLKLSPPGAW